MNPGELRRLAQVLNALRALRGTEEILRFLRENRKLARSLSPDQLAEIGERTDYDRDAWERIVRELLREE